MRRGGNQNLFITVGGDVAPLQSAMKAGKSILNEFGGAAIDIQAEVTKAFAGMAANAPAEAKRIEQSYEKTFAAIRRNAQEVLNAPNGAGAVAVINATGARQAAEAAEAQAAAHRQAADAAIRLDKAAGGTNAALRTFAISTEAAAQESAQYAAALRNQYNVLDQVEAELLGGAAAQQRYNQQQLKTNSVTGQSRAGMQQLSYQLGDVATQFAAGTPPQIIFAQQIGQVTQAMSLMTNKTTGFLGFIGGPWGIALSSAAVLMTPLIGKLFETEEGVDDLVRKMQEQAGQARLNELANKIWERSLDGLIEKQKKLREEQDRQLQTDRQVQQQRLSEVRAARDAADQEAARAKRNLAAARQRVVEAERGVVTAQAMAGGEGGGVGLAIALDQLGKAKQAVVDLASKYNAATVEAGNFHDLIAGQEILIARRNAEALGDPLTAIKNKYEDLRTAAENAARGNDKLRASLDATLASINKRERAELEEEQKRRSDTKKGATEAVQFALAAQGPISSGIGPRGGRNHNGLDIAVPVGTPVKAPAAGTVKVGSDPKGFGIFVRIDHGGGTQTTLGHLSQVKVKEGQFVEQGELVALSGNTGRSTGPHVHQETRSGGKVVDPRRKALPTDRAGRALAGTSAVAKLEDEEERKRRKKIDQDDAFASQMQRLDQDLLSAQTELIAGVEAQARIAASQVAADQERYALALQNDVNDGRLRKEQADLLIAKGAEVALQRRTNIEAKAFLGRLEEQNRSLSQETQFRVDALEYAGENARTLDEQRQIQLDIIDAMYRQREADLKLAKAKATMAQDWDEVARVDRSLAELPAQRGRDEARARRETLSPMEAYRERLTTDLADIDRLLEEIQVRGLEGLEDDLAAATVEALGLKGALGDVVGELIRVAFQMAQLALLQSGPGGNGLGFLTNLGNLLSGKRAAGGPVNQDELYLVGERGPELFIPGASGTIIPNHVLAAASMPRVPKNVHQRVANDDRAISRGGDVHHWKIVTPDANSFRRSERQIRTEAQRRMRI